MEKTSLTSGEMSELNRYVVWLARLSKSLNFMLNLVDNLPVTPQNAGKHTVQERNKMLRLALEDLKVERENFNHAIEGLQEEYQNTTNDFSGLNK
jgi:hypothetical protein